ncbi:hypothetical protein MUK42_35406 [Musa troglodytarum]|uniref:Uncharacterized protein n=1 Tax=Musa troglodytarum TaxID=320322 RepID=A0A9E7FMK7_9LILI|nr:hypothetical protein MUK42_35406 [Musa troglodytarum]
MRAPCDSARQQPHHEAAVSAKAKSKKRSVAFQLHILHSDDALAQSAVRIFLSALGRAVNCFGTSVLIIRRRKIVVVLLYPTS